MSGQALVKVFAGRLHEFLPGDIRFLDVAPPGIGVLNVAGRLHALSNRCPHMGAPLCLGAVTGTVVNDGRAYIGEWVRDGEILRCPWHAWEFDIVTGKTLTDPPRRVRRFEVTVEDDDVFVYVPGTMVRNTP